MFDQFETLKGIPNQQSHQNTPIYLVSVKILLEEPSAQFSFFTKKSAEPVSNTKLKVLLATSVSPIYNHTILDAVPNSAKLTYYFQIGLFQDIYQTLVLYCSKELKFYKTPYIIAKCHPDATFSLILLRCRLYLIHPEVELILGTSLAIDEELGVCLVIVSGIGDSISCFTAVVSILAKWSMGIRFRQHLRGDRMVIMLFGSHFEGIPHDGLSGQLGAKGVLEMFEYG
ncbi:hypothetical protein BC833DRAFT_569507 [Globomyces pollinis-pini]|nr:hypothetical protein BC833DRAFT_569507 [Globomyces pollinis-pini]